VHFLNDGGETFNEAAEFMAKNFFIRTAEIGLFVGLIAHIVDGLMLWSANKKNALYNMLLYQKIIAHGTLAQWVYWVHYYYFS
jgi:hypothetical protein